MSHRLRLPVQMCTGPTLLPKAYSLFGASGAVPVYPCSPTSPKALGQCLPLGCPVAIQAHLSETLSHPQVLEPDLLQLWDVPFFFCGMFLTSPYDTIWPPTPGVQYRRSAHSHGPGYLLPPITWLGDMTLLLREASCLPASGRDPKPQGGGLLTRQLCGTVSPTGSTAHLCCPTPRQWYSWNVQFPMPKGEKAGKQCNLQNHSSPQGFPVCTAHCPCLPTTPQVGSLLTPHTPLAPARCEARSPPHGRWFIPPPFLCNPAS